MFLRILLCLFLTSCVKLQTPQEDGCCGGYHIGLLENMTNTLSSSRNDKSVQSQENSKSIKSLGEEIGKYFKELGDDFGKNLEDLRKGLGNDLSENQMELKDNREEMKISRQYFLQEIKEHGTSLENNFEKQIKELGNGLERNFGREIKDLKEGLRGELRGNREELINVVQAIKKLSVNLGGLEEEMKKGNRELREERKAQHEEMMMVFNRLFANNGSDSWLHPSGATDVSHQVKEETPSQVTETLSNTTCCAFLYKSGNLTSGIYKIKPEGVREEFDVYCDMENDGGGWTVIQRRGNFDTPGDFFYKSWDEYKRGFGKPDKEHWLGNDKISALTRQGAYELDIQMLDYDNYSIFANYKEFEVEGEELLYRLHVGNFSGNDHDSMSAHNEMSFSTFDRDNDNVDYNCAVKYAGAWWYNYCHDSNLNSKKDRNKSYLCWVTFLNDWDDLSSVLMKIRPLSF